jgi:hypothetical protein
MFKRAPAQNCTAEAQAKTSFSEEEAKRLFHTGPWALERQRPWPRVKKVFAPLFSKSGCFMIKT